MPGEARARLLELWEEAKTRGGLGPAPVEDHLAHAEALAALLAPGPEEFVDLGTGAGVPGLALLLAWPEAAGVFVEARARWASWVRRAAGALEIQDRVTVLTGRAEVLAHRAEWREHAPMVVARAFGAPAVTAECATGFLAVGGVLAVSEPPAGEARWPAEGLARLGFDPALVRRQGPVAVMVARKTQSVGDEWPRREGVPNRRPLWAVPGDAEAPA